MDQKAVLFRFLRQPSKPTAPRPVAKSGREAGSGVGTRLVFASKVSVSPGPSVILNCSVIPKGAANELIRMARSLVNVEPVISGFRCSVSPTPEHEPLISFALTQVVILSKLSAPRGPDIEPVT